MNACDLSSSGLTRGSSVLKTWMPDQVGHDSFAVVGRAYLSVIPAKAGIHVSVVPEKADIHVSVIPAHAGIHARKPWMPDQVGHDSFEVVAHDSFDVVGHDSFDVVGHDSFDVVGHDSLGGCA